MPGEPVGNTGKERRQENHTNAPASDTSNHVIGFLGCVGATKESFLFMLAKINNRHIEAESHNHDRRNEPPWRSP